ncbi:TPA: hypothetical protein DEP96_04040 [Candidatus Uhrbacteria bacterium]|nr:hypothetical protein [Candidatus Uhrbacteria bacterium]
MKTIELRRHSIKSGPGDSNLSAEGLELARLVGATALRGRGFTHLLVSSLQRTTDTMLAFAEGAGDFTVTEIGRFLTDPDVFGTDNALQLWHGVCYQAELNGEDMMTAIMEQDSVEAEHIASNATAQLRLWLNSLPADAQVLVVHHSPSLELIAYGLFGITLPQLQPCDGFRILVDGDNLRPISIADDSSLRGTSANIY